MKEKYIKVILISTFSVAVIGLGYVYKDEVKSFIKKVFGGNLFFDKSLQWWREGSWGIKTYNALMELHPDFRGQVKKFFDEVEKELGIRMIITSGFRTPSQQAALNESIQASPNYSFHQYGFAIDVNGMKEGQIIIQQNSSRQKWIDSGIVNIAKKNGLEWGVNDGDSDRVHFFVRPKGKTASQLYALLKEGKTDSKGYVVV